MSDLYALWGHKGVVEPALPNVSIILNLTAIALLLQVIVEGLRIFLQLIDALDHYSGFVPPDRCFRPQVSDLELKVADQILVDDFVLVVLHLGVDAIEFDEFPIQVRVANSIRLSLAGVALVHFVRGPQLLAN